MPFWYTTVRYIQDNYVKAITWIIGIMIAAVVTTLIAHFIEKYLVDSTATRLKFTRLSITSLMIASSSLALVVIDQMGLDEADVCEFIGF